MRTTSPSVAVSAIGGNKVPGRWSAAPSSSGTGRSSGSRVGSSMGGDRGQRGVEDLRGEVDLVVGDGQRRRHPQAVGGAAGAAADEVDRQAAPLALLGQREAERL